VDVSAQRAIELAPIGRRMLEIGCGRGTKTLLWADRARERFQDAPTTVQVIGVDNVARKIETARADAQRLGYDEITYQRADATVLDTVDDTSCDVVFVDAPCSGLGTLRRHSDKRLTLRPDDIEDLARLGRALMEAAARKVAKGGYLVYATCTMSRRENEAVVTAFLDTEAGVSFTPDPIVEAELTADITGSLDEYGFVQMRPRSGGGDGHFIARLKRD